MNFNKKNILRIIVRKKKKIYKNKYIPSIIYNKNYNLPILISLKNVNKIFKKKDYIINIIYKKKIYIVLIKDIQFNILRNKIIHIDFYKIDNKNTEFITYVNVKTKGKSIGVLKGAICNIILKKIKIKTTLKNYHKIIYINISNLDIGDKIYIKDILNKYKNIKFLHNYNQIIISLKINKINKDEKNKK
ncbi:MAG: 50S ribosomal protein L25 [Candidatus Shikimatogenerans bostrichidophilus]|nr:MAG: 50S ribosomal protein L25 [Candidatus Shikimatogenerans bostrichidophilus]